MRSRSKGIVAAAALALACALPGAASAETDVVLSNESRGTEVHTGEAHVVNGTQTSSSSDVDPSQAATANTGAQADGSVTAVAPTTAAPAASAATSEEPTQVARAVETLFVGLPAGGTTVTP
ncbi:MAG TPA: hypothetical protein VFA34_16415 [Actinomycetota bacterium]|jgi:hypothetical protein|nr:hypothetical protein [Actinomycetota bacterium]